MSNADPTPSNCPLTDKVRQLLDTEIKNLHAPLLDEIQRLVDEAQQYQAGLERENEELRKTQHFLEAYRARYVDLYDFAPLGYATLDQDGFLQEINLAGAKMLGADREALTGYSFREYVAEEDRQAFLDHVRQCVRQRREVTAELRLVAKDGRPMAVQVRSIPIEGPKEDTLCKTAITDVTERKRAEDALAQERNLLRTLIDNLPDYIYVKDAQCRFIAANLATAQIMGASSPEDLLGKTDHDFYPPELAAEYRADEERLLGSGQALLNKDEPHRDAEGNPRTILTTKVPLKDSQGKVVGLVGISRGITERKQVEELLRKVQQQAEQNL